MTDIKGYRDLTEEEITLANDVKEAEIEIGDLWREISSRANVDKRWMAIAKTHFQEGFSAMIRSVTQPEDVF